MTKIGGWVSEKICDSVTLLMTSFVFYSKLKRFKKIYVDVIF